MPTLHYMPGSAAMAPHAALEEAGAAYELALVERVDGRSPPAYLAVNPLGRVPAYVDGPLVLWESAAICIHIADTYPAAALLPPVGGAERAVALRWLVYLTNTVQATFLHHAYPQRLLGAGDEAAAAAVTAGAGRNLDAAFDHIDALLGDGAYILGDRFSVSDLYLHMLTRWCRRLPRKPWSLPHVGSHYTRVSERPAVVRMLARQGIEARPNDH
ncbi:MAG TPA: glutathione S-transferase N-terminal domain-containing protein [Mycobacteriales bacterium]|nr:glutathione S-transferase N-terminal domain-containing protein [Mycobacteriales bacterium]